VSVEMLGDGFDILVAAPRQTHHDAIGGAELVQHLMAASLSHQNVEAVHD